MSLFRNGRVCIVGFAGALSCGVLLGCGASDGSVEAGEMDSVHLESQPVISGAAVTRRFNSATVAPNGSFTVSLSCPSGSVLVGGGFISSAGTRVYASNGSGNGWSASNFNPTTSSTSFIVETECLTGTAAAAVQVNGTAAPLAAHSNLCQTMNCPSGSFPVSGGWNAGPAVVPYASQPSGDGRGWTVCGTNTSSANSSFQASVNCLKGVNGSVKADVRGLTIPAKSQGFFDVVCPTGLLLGGGIFTASDFVTRLNGSAQASSRSFTTANKWSTVITNNNSTAVFASAGGACLNLSL
jgi:hypothetical protein